MSELETIRIDNDEFRIDTDRAIRIDMDLETQAASARQVKYTSPSGGKFATIWKGTP